MSEIQQTANQKLTPLSGAEAPKSPCAGDGAESAAASALETALDRAADHVRHPRDPDERYVSGKFAIGNSAALKHGRRARVSLAARRLAILEDWRAQERGSDGQVPRDVDTVLMELADAQAIAERAMWYLEHCRESFVGSKYQRALSAKQSSTDRIARLLALLDTIRPAVAVADATGQVRIPVHFRGQYRAGQGEMPGLEICTVRTRAEMLEALGEQAPVADDEDDVEPVPGQVLAFGPRPDLPVDLPADVQEPEPVEATIIEPDEPDNALESIGGFSYNPPRRAAGTVLHVTGAGASIRLDHGEVMITPVSGLTRGARVACIWRSETSAWTVSEEA
jgi:hypothetical protein